MAALDSLTLTGYSGFLLGDCFSRQDMFSNRVKDMICKVPLLLEPQPEGGFTVTSPILPELVTEGDTIEEAMDNVHDALLATIEMYQDLGRPLPRNVQISDTASPVWLEALITTS
jgi:antitoxin HicB